MKNGVYALQNKLTGRYGQVFSLPTDGFAIYAITKMLDSNPNENREIELLYKVGEIDLETGELTRENAKLIPWESTPMIEKEAEK